MYIYKEINKKQQLVYKNQMKSRFQQIRSFDRYILEDQLITILNRSPQTQVYVSNRVTEIIMQIMSTPLIQDLQIRIAELQQQIELLQQQKKEINYTHSKQSNKNSNALNKYVNKIKQLQKQLKILKDVEVQRDNYRIQIDQLSRDNQQLTAKLGNFQLKDQKYVEQISKLKSNAGNSQGQMEQMRKTLNFKEQQLKFLRQQVQKLKKICKQTKFNEIKIRKQHQSLHKQRQQLYRQMERIKQQIRLQKLHRQNQRKSLHTKLNQQYNKGKTMQKARKKLKRLLQQQKQMKKQLNRLKQYYMKGIKTLEEEVKRNSYIIMDEIGEQVNKQLKELISQISKNSVQLRVCKQQLRIKDQIIEKLQRVSTVQIMGNKQLQKQLKSKKIQADSLRKQLKKNYQQSEIKLMGLQSSYRHILASSPNYPIR